MQGAAVVHTVVQARRHSHPQDARQGEPQASPASPVDGFVVNPGRSGSVRQPPAAEPRIMHRGDLDALPLEGTGGENPGGGKSRGKSCGDSLKLKGASAAGKSPKNEATHWVWGAVRSCQQS